MRFLTFLILGVNGFFTSMAHSTGT